MTIGSTATSKAPSATRQCIQKSPGPGSATPAGQLDEGVAAAVVEQGPDAGVGEVGSGQVGHGRDVDRSTVGVRAVASGRPPTPAEGRGRRHADRRPRAVDAAR